MAFSRNKKIIITIFLAAVLSSVFYFGRQKISEWPINTLAVVIKIYDKISDSVGLSLNIFRPKSDLIRENEFLKNKVNDLEVRILNLSFSIENSQNIQGDLAGRLLASPISFAPRTPYDTIIIDRGTDAGITVGSKAFIFENIYIGVVETVFNKKSIIRLASSPGVKTEVVIDDSGEVVELIGMGGGNFKLDLPADFNLKEDDVFMLPGLSKHLVAKISASKKNEDTSLVSVFLTPPVKIDGNSTIYVEI